MALDLVDVGRAVGGEVGAVDAGAAESGDGSSYWVGWGGRGGGVSARYGDIRRLGQGVY